MSFCPQKRGPGYWKLNNSLLYDKDYVKKINRVIEIETSVENMSAKSKWENLKLAIRNSTLQYSAQCKKSNKLKVEVLECKLKLLEQELDGIYIGPRFIDTDEQIRVVKHEPQKIYKLKARGAMICSRYRFAKDGEKPSKYYLNLEKKIFKPKQYID